MSFTNASKIFKLVGAEAVLTEASDLRRYLTGISTSFGYVVSDKKGNTFYTDARYLESATKALNGSELSVKEFKAPLEDLLSGYKEIAVPVGRTLYTDYRKLVSAGLEVKDSLPAFTSAMAVKESYELDCIRRACNIADRAFEALCWNILCVNSALAGQALIRLLRLVKIPAFLITKRVRESSNSEISF